MLVDSKARQAQPRKAAYQLPDGRGLALVVSPSGGKSWSLRYRHQGRAGAVRLGGYPEYSLTEARQWRDDTRALLARGLDPAELKKGKVPQRGDQRREAAIAYVGSWYPEQAHIGEATVTELSKKWLERYGAEERTRNRTISYLANDILPVIGSQPVPNITTRECTAILDTVLKRGESTALKCRSVMLQLFDFAVAQGYSDTNPVAPILARTIGTPKSRDVTLTLQEVGRLMASCYAGWIDRRLALPIHLLAITLLRKTEVTKATWAEIDIEGALWTIPAERMKTGKAHRVPLTRQSIAILEELRTYSGDSEYILPSKANPEKPIADNTLNAALERVQHEMQKEPTLHDLRRTGSTILHDAGYSSDWIEAALSHAMRGVRGVYCRTDWLDKRRGMMTDYSSLVDGAIFAAAGTIRKPRKPKPIPKPLASAPSAPPAAQGASYMATEYSVTGWLLAQVEGQTLESVKERIEALRYDYLSSIVITYAGVPMQRKAGQAEEWVTIHPTEAETSTTR